MGWHGSPPMPRCLAAAVAAPPSTARGGSSGSPPKAARSTVARAIPTGMAPSTSETWGASRQEVLSASCGQSTLRHHFSNGPGYRLTLLRESPERIPEPNSRTGSGTDPRADSTSDASVFDLGFRGRAMCLCGASVLGELLGCWRRGWGNRDGARRVATCGIKERNQVVHGRWKNLTRMDGDTARGPRGQ